MSNRPLGFEERLKAALLARIPATPEPLPARSFARRYGVPLAVGLVTAAVLGLVTLPDLREHGGAGPAHGLGKDGDGTVTVPMPKPDELPELARRLEAMGVSAVVVPMKPPAECPGENSGGYRESLHHPDGTIDLEGNVVRGRGTAMVLKINSKTVPPGHTLVLMKPMRPPLRDPNQVRVGVKETSKVPACEPDYAPSPEEESRQLAEMDAALKALKDRQDTGTPSP
ncbi:hypothetical protein [Streptomyces sp. NPDC048349]|uniref:hypothetical protein n=1 Tax=Streptomyces sp. NPDC048349 TaxID=3155486 RepID=UPI003445E251